MNPTAIITADIHLRDDQPVCRTDDYWKAQDKKVEFLRALQYKYGCAVLIAGDIFHRAKSSPYLEAWAMSNLPDHIICIPGQHDLPNHALDDINKSSLGVLHTAGKVNVLVEGGLSRVGHRTSVYGYPWGTELRGLRRKGAKRRVALCHELTWHKEKPFPDCKAGNATSLLKKMIGFDLVVVGDNHKAFLTRDKQDRRILSPGSMMRMTADQSTDMPGVWLWWEEDNKIDTIDYPFEVGVVSREHIKTVELRDKRVEVFVSKLKKGYEAGLDFEKNLETFFKKNKVNKAVQDLVWEAVE